MDMVVQFRGTIYEKGYGNVAQMVMRDKSLKPTAKAIYAYLCSFAWGRVDSDRKAFPTVKQQCEELGITKDTYYKHRSALEEKGYITIESVYGGDGKFRNNLYYIESTPCPKKMETDETVENKEVLTCPKKPDTEKSYTRKSTTKKSDTNTIIPLRREFNNNKLPTDKGVSPTKFIKYDWVNR